MLLINENLPDIKFSVVSRLYTEVSSFIDLYADDPDKFINDLYVHRDFLRTQGANVYDDGVVIQSFLCSIGLDITYTEVKEFFLDNHS